MAAAAQAAPHVGEEFGCPLWGPDGGEAELDAAVFGIYDSGELTSVPLREGLEPIEVQQLVDGGGLGTARFVWRAAAVLCRWLAGGALVPEAGSAGAAPLRAVELGAGTGLCAAALARSLAGGCRVLATDLAAALPLIRDTMRRNGLESTVEVAELDWSDVELPTASIPGTAWQCLDAADLVVGADLSYSDALNPMLFAVLRRACQGGAVALLAHQHRGGRDDLIQPLSDLAKSGFEWAELPPLMLDCESDAEEFSIYMLSLPQAQILGDEGRLATLGHLAAQTARRRSTCVRS